MKTVFLYTDGGAEPNPGKGGFGVILKYENYIKEFKLGFDLTTNNRMELMSVIFGLKQLKENVNVKVYSDSKYVVEAINQDWITKWQQRKWFKTKSKRVKNSDLWKALMPLLEKHDVEFIWVKGHAGHVQNERCDFLANEAKQSENLLKDTGYLKEIERKENKNTSLFD